MFIQVDMSKDSEWCLKILLYSYYSKSCDTNACNIIVGNRKLFWKSVSTPVTVQKNLAIVYYTISNVNLSCLANFWIVAWLLSIKFYIYREDYVFQIVSV